MKRHAHLLSMLLFVSALVCAGSMEAVVDKAYEFDGNWLELDGGESSTFESETTSREGSTTIPATTSPSREKPETTSRSREKPETTSRSREKPETTSPPLENPKRLNLTIFNTTTLIGLETLGPVRVYHESVELGVPSFKNDTVYTPFEGITITIPAGAWLTSERRESQTRRLTLSIFELPEGLANRPGTPAGPGIDLAPHDQILLKPILVTLPVFGNHSGSHAPYWLDPASLQWTRLLAPTPDHSALMQRLGTAAAFAPETSLPLDVATGEDLSHVIIGWTIGGVGIFVVCCAILWEIVVRRDKLKKKNQIDAYSTQGSAGSTQEGELVIISGKA